MNCQQTSCSKSSDFELQQNPIFTILTTDSTLQYRNPREGWQRLARSKARTSSAQPDPQGHA